MLHCVRSLNKYSCKALNPTEQLYRNILILTGILAGKFVSQISYYGEPALERVWKAQNKFVSK